MGNQERLSTPSIPTSLIRSPDLLSPDYLAARFTAPEWAARFAQDATSEHDLLIPVRVRPCELKGLSAAT